MAARMTIQALLLQSLLRGAFAQELDSESAGQMETTSLLQRLSRPDLSELDLQPVLMQRAAGNRSIEALEKLVGDKPGQVDTTVSKKCKGEDQGREIITQNKHALVNVVTEWPNRTQWERMCNKTMEFPQPCSGEVRIKHSDTRKHCVQEMRHMGFHDSGLGFRMNAYMPESIDGGAQVTFPHLTTFTTRVEIDLQGGGDDAPEVFVFYNNRSYKDQASNCKWVRKDSGKLERTLPRLGFQSPVHGPPYDVNIERPKSWGVEHGIAAEMWQKRLAADEKLSFKIYGSKSPRRPACYGMVVKGACKVIVD